MQKDVESSNLGSSTLNPVNPDVLTNVANLYHTWYVGEDENIKLLFLALLTKNLRRENRLHVIVTGESSSGKSFLVNTILKALPFGGYIHLTRFTSAYLERLEESLDGQILFYEQYDGHISKQGPDPFSTLKFVLSEGKLTLGVVEENELGKKHSANKEVQGMPVFISTSVRVDIDPETLNRVIITSIDESEDQTLRILSYESKLASNPILAAKGENVKHQLFSLVKQYSDAAKEVYDIAIPFADKLISLMPLKDVKIRRDFNKIINLTKVVAFAHYPLRKTVRLVIPPLNKEKKIVVSTPDDFREAMDIGNKAFRQTLHNLSTKAMAIHEQALKLLDNSNEDGIKIKDISKNTRYSLSRARELMNQLENMGYWVHEKEGRENIYQPTPKKFNELDLSSINFSEEELNAWRATYFADADIIEPGESFSVEKVEKVTSVETEPQNTPITQIEHKSDSSIKHDATKN